MSRVEREVCDIAASTLDVKRSLVHPDSTWDDHDADSLAVVELMFALEEHFHISFEVAELEGIKSVADVVRLIERKLGAR